MNQAYTCATCGTTKSTAEFSKTQLAKHTTRRCKQCVTNHTASRNQSKLDSDPARPIFVRVRDVPKKFGHAYEIPMQAYIEAGVATSRNDFVTKEDVERASDEWDARGIAHDIDTQWGMIPEGGAYKDSNRYFGPGDYDFY